MQNIVIRTSRSQVKQMVTNSECSEIAAGDALKKKQNTGKPLKYGRSAKTEAKQKQRNWIDIDLTLNLTLKGVIWSRAQPCLPVCLTEVTRLVWGVFLNENGAAACPHRCPSFITCISVKLGADCVLCRISRLCNNRLSSVRLDWHRASSGTLHSQTQSASGLERLLKVGGN